MATSIDHRRRLGDPIVVRSPRIRRAPPFAPGPSVYPAPVSVPGSPARWLGCAALALAASGVLASFGAGVSEAAPPCPKPPTTCRVKVEGLPAAVLVSGDYSLRVGDRQYNLDASELEVELDAPARASLRGPAFVGATTLEPEACAEGPVALQARPKPAKLELISTAELELLAVECVDGCSFGPLPATKLPPVSIARGEVSRRVQLSFRAAGYVAMKQSYVLTPGENRLVVRLEPLR